MDVVDTRVVCVAGVELVELDLSLCIENCYFPVFATDQEEKEGIRVGRIQRNEVGRDNGRVCRDVGCPNI